MSRWKTVVESIAAMGCEYREPDCFSAARQFCRSCLARLALKPPGTQVIPPETVARIREMRAAGDTLEKIAKAVGLAVSTVWRAVKPDDLPTTTDGYWWTSFWKTDALGDFTLYCPWWVSGVRGDGAEAICAAIPAESADDARRIVASAFDDEPEVVAVEWRFCTRKSGPDPFTDRFQKADWMEWPPKKRTDRIP